MQPIDGVGVDDDCEHGTVGRGRDRFDVPFEILAKVGDLTRGEIVVLEALELALLVR